MPHTKSLHNYQGVSLSASTKLSWQKNPEQINNPEQFTPRGAIWSGLSDCFLHHSRSADCSLLSCDLRHTVHVRPSMSAQAIMIFYLLQIRDNFCMAELSLGF